MSKIERIAMTARQSPESLTFQEFESLLVSLGFRFDRQRGSHKIYVAPNGERLSIQSRNGLAKNYQVRQALKLAGE